MSAIRLVIVALIPAMCVPAGPAQGDDAGGLTATLSTSHRHVPPGRPIWVDFTITNQADEPVELAVPGTKALPSAGIVGLPITHVFSGEAFAALSISGELGQEWDVALGYQPPATSEALVLGSHASVGVSLEVTQYYPVLRGPGQYRLRWKPYGGTVVSNEIIIEVDKPKQAVIQTDHGTMVVRFFYDAAPNTIDNFIELAKAGFYDNLTFHRIVPGYCIQGGCPNGDGTGIRADGVKLAAELSDHPVRRGTLCMARLEDDLDSASCQFLICNTRVPQWDGRYTVFGELVGDESLATLDKLMSTPVGLDGTPKEKLYTRAIRIVDAPSQSVPRQPF